MISSANNFVSLFRIGRYRDQGYIYSKVLPNAYVLNKPLNKGTDAQDYHQRLLSDGRYLVFLGPISEEDIQKTITGLVMGLYSGHRATYFKGGIAGLQGLLHRHHLKFEIISRTYDDIPSALLHPKTFNYNETNIREFADLAHGWTMLEVDITPDQWEELKPSIKHACPYGYLKDKGLLYICATSHHYKKQKTIKAQLLQTAQQPFLALQACIMADDRDGAKQWYYQVQRDVFNRRIPGIAFNTADDDEDERPFCWDWDKHETGIGSVYDYIKRFLMSASGTIQEACQVCVERETDFV